MLTGSSNYDVDIFAGPYKGSSTFPVTHVIRIGKTLNPLPFSFSSTSSSSPFFSGQWCGSSISTTPQVVKISVFGQAERNDKRTFPNRS